MFALHRLEWLFLALALVLCPGQVFGAEPGASLFDRLDRNKDGYLSPEELAADEAKDRNWIAIDRDRDGRISRSEFNLIVAQPPKPQPSAAAGAGGSASPQPKQE